MKTKFFKYIILLLLISSSTFSAFCADNVNNLYRFGVWDKGNTAIVDNDGSISGFEPELFKGLESFLPNKVEIVAYETKDECLDALRNNQIDVCMSCLYDENIALEFEFNNIMVRHVDFMVGSYYKAFSYQEYNSMQNKTIGYIDKGKNVDSIIKQLTNKMDNPIFIPYNNINNIQEALINDELDLAIFCLECLTPKLSVLDRLDSFPTYYITRKGESLVINEALSQFLSSSLKEYSDLYYKYYPRAITTEFTKDELNYIKSNPEIIVSTIRNKNVFSSISKSGEIIGIFPDMIKAINEESGLNMQMLLTPKSKTLQEMVKNKECEVAIGLDSLKAVDNNKEYIYCDSIMKIPMELIVKSITVLKKYMTHKIVVSREGCLSDTFIKENYPNWIVLYEKDIEKRYGMLIDGEVDCLVDSSYSFNYLSTAEKYNNLIRYPISIFSSDLNILVQDDNPILAKIINKSLRKVKKEKLDSIVEYNLSNITYSMTLYDIFLSNRLEYLGIFLLLVIFFFIIYFMASNRRRKELEQINTDLMVAEQTAIEANQSKSVFLARMSHDMRTPLGAVIALADFGRKETKEENIKSYFLDIDDSATYLLSLLDDILDSQKLQNDDFIFNYKVVNFCEIVKRILTVIDNKAKEKNLRIEIINKCSDFFDNILADEKRISQIYVNILNNAIKYTPKGGIITWENSYKLVKDDVVRIKSIIKDTGVGMSEDFVNNQIFEPFTKEDNTLSKVEGGTGLGLNICKKLVDQMNGSIKCESVLDVGTTFTIEIDHKIVKDKIKNTINNSQKDDSVFIGKKILVCDDTEINLKITKKILEIKNIDVDVAYNGEEALNKVMATKYDLILMDIRMPVLDGLEATKKIRKINKEIPIIAFSANAYLDDVEKSLEAGMNDHLAKPIDTEKLYNLLYKYLKKES